MTKLTFHKATPGADDHTVSGIPHEAVPFGGRYELGEVLGEGGVGTVLSATRKSDRCEVAIKILRLDKDHTPSRTRLRREAEIMSQIDSPHVPRVLEQGVDPVMGSFLVLERIHGRTLSQTLSKDGPLPLGAACDVVRQVANALAVAHQNGFIHRDVKPSNVLVSSTRSGALHIKLLDFGIAKDLGRFATKLTRDDQPLGSPGFLAPEQISCPSRADGRADVWALGVLLYTCLTGVSPFARETSAETFSAILTGDYEPLYQRCVGVPRAVDDWIACACNQRPALRFATVTAAAEALSELCARYSLAPTCAVPRSSIFAPNDCETLSLAGAAAGGKRSVRPQAPWVVRP